MSSLYFQVNLSFNIIERCHNVSSRFLCLVCPFKLSWWVFPHHPQCRISNNFQTTSIFYKLESRSCYVILICLLNGYGCICRLACNACNAWNLLNVINIILIFFFFFIEKQYYFKSRLSLVNPLKNFYLSSYFMTWTVDM